MIRIAVIQWPTSHSDSDREIISAVERAGMQAQTVLWTEPKEKLADFQGIILAGHSDQDCSRTAAIAALDSMMEGIKEQSRLGKPILGICHGAHILVASGLVPGLERDQLGLALTDNKRMQQGKVVGTGFYDGWVHIRLAEGYQWNAFTRRLAPKNILRIPVAHAEGRFIIPPVLLAEIERNGLHVFQYCDEEGNRVDEFPVNPNGSIHNIAAIASKAGNVMAMMPHPERISQGDVIFQSMREYIADGYVAQPVTLDYQPRVWPIKKYQASNTVYACVVEMISDQHAMLVESVLQPVKVKRAIYWEIQCDSAAVFEKIKATGVLLDDPKNKIINSQEINNTQNTVFLVRAKEDVLGLQKLELLKNDLGIEGVQSISHGVLWSISTLERDRLERVIRSHILFNPYIHDCYYY